MHFLRTEVPKSVIEKYIRYQSRRPFLGSGVFPSFRSNQSICMEIVDSFPSNYISFWVSCEIILKTNFLHIPMIVNILTTLKQIYSRYRKTRFVQHNVAHESVFILRQLILILEVQCFSYSAQIYLFVVQHTNDFLPLAYNALVEFVTISKVV